MVWGGGTVSILHSQITIIFWNLINIEYVQRLVQETEGLAPCTWSLCQCCLKCLYFLDLAAVGIAYWSLVTECHRLGNRPSLRACLDTGSPRSTFWQVLQVGRALFLFVNCCFLRCPYKVKRQPALWCLSLYRTTHTCDFIYTLLPQRPYVLSPSHFLVAQHWNLEGI